jgi:hypothetical protein
LEYANAKASLRAEHIAAASGGGSVSTNRLSELIDRSRGRLMNESLGGLVLFVLIPFLGPLVAAALLIKRIRAMQVVVSISALLFLWDLGIAAFPEGGDYKGCTNCGGPFFAHIAFGYISLAFAVITIVVGVVANSARSREMK